MALVCRVYSLAERLIYLETGAADPGWQGAFVLLGLRDVENAFETVLEPTSPFNDVRGQPVFDYFQDTYIGRPRRRGPRQSTLYEIGMWNVHDRVLSDSAKSNSNNKPLWRTNTIAFSFMEFTSRIHSWQLNNLTPGERLRV